MEKFIKNTFWQLIAGVGSLLLSIIIFSHKQPFNIDGLLYLETAQSYLENGFSAAIAVFNWPFYSILIAVTSQMTTLSLMNAAYLWTFIFPAMTVMAFISLLKEMGASNRVLFFGTIVVLIFPYFNHARDNILRDLGYLPFFLLAILQFMRFVNTEKLKNALLWGLFICIATLFRIEGAIFLLLIPFCLIFNTEWTVKNRIVNIVKAHSFLILIGAVSLSYYCLSVIGLYPEFDTHNIGRLKNFSANLLLAYSAITNAFPSQAELYASSVLNEFAQPFAKSMLTGSLIGLFTWKLLTTFSPLYLALNCHSFKTGSLKTSFMNKLVLYSFICVNVMILAYFMGTEFFISARYLLTLCLLLLLFVPFSLSQLMKTRSLGVVLSLILTVMLIDTLHHFGTSKTYIIDAGSWIKKHTPHHSEIFSNTKQLIFYANRAGYHPIKKEVGFEKITPSIWDKYEYVALRFDEEENHIKTKIESILKRQPALQFENQQGDMIAIYSRDKSAL